MSSGCRVRITGLLSFEREVGELVEPPAVVPAVMWESASWSSAQEYLCISIRLVKVGIHKQHL